MVRRAHLVGPFKGALLKELYTRYFRFLTQLLRASLEFVPIFVFGVGVGIGADTGMALER